MMLSILFKALPLVWSCSSVLQTGFQNFTCRVVFGSARPCMSDELLSFMVYLLQLLDSLQSLLPFHSFKALALIWSCSCVVPTWFQNVKCRVVCVR